MTDLGIMDLMRPGCHHKHDHAHNKKAFCRGSMAALLGGPSPGLLVGEYQCQQLTPNW